MLEFRRMGPVHKSAVSLRVIGDDLDPDEIAAVLGCTPTRARKPGGQAPAMWCLESAGQEPEAVDRQIDEILSRLTGDLNVWSELGRRYRLDLFCGLFMRTGNEGVEISPAGLAALGRRGINLALDIYGPA
jgi:hypothetical protein